MGKRGVNHDDGRCQGHAFLGREKMHPRRKNGEKNAQKRNLLNVGAGRKEYRVKRGNHLRRKERTLSVTR